MEEEEEDVIEHLEQAEEKLEEIKEHNGDPGDPETSKNIKQAESMVSTLRKDKKLTLKKLVKLKQIVGYMSKKLELDQEEEVISDLKNVHFSFSARATKGTSLYESLPISAPLLNPHLFVTNLLT